MLSVGRQLFIIVALGFLILSSANAHNSQRDYVKAIYSLPLTLDPIKMHDAVSLSVGNLIYDGLLKFSPSLQLEGALAKSWSTSKDGKTLTFKLRKNIFFHSGEPITAMDAEFSLRRALSPDSTVQKLYDSIKAIRVIDSKTLEIELKYPFPPFLSVLAGATAKILPKKDLSHKNFFKNPIGSGPFIYSSISSKKREVILNSFTNYYLTKPQVSRIILKETIEKEALELAKEGKIDDLSSWPLTSSNPIFKSGQKVSSPTAATWIIGMNTLKPPFNDRKIRQLFKVSIPVEDFRKEFYPDSLRANGYVPHGLAGSQVKVSLSVDNIKPPKEKITIVIPSELARASEMKKMLEKEMITKGWNVEVQLMAWNQLMEGYSKKSHQAFLVSMNMDYPDADFLLKNFESKNVDNFSGIKNLEIDELIKKSRSTQDRKIREEYYKKALELIEYAAVTVNLFHPRANYWISKCVQGFRPNMLSEVYIDYAKISFSQDCISNKVVQ